MANARTRPDCRFGMNTVVAPALCDDLISLPWAAPPILAVGAWLKNTVCFANQSEALLSPTVGDLNSAEACRAHEQTITRLLQLCTVSPLAIAHDWHPDFYSTRFALQLSAELGVEPIAVQHHHAHIAAVCAEFGLTEPVLGLALDGIGLGTDGDAWGGELLHVDGDRFERLGHFLPLPLAGGDAAAHEPWRMAAGVLHALKRTEEIQVRYGHEPAAETVQRMLDKRINAPLSSSAGRVFDAAAALLGVCLRMRFEAEAPILLEQAATRYIAEKGWPEIATDMWCIRDGILNLLPLLESLIDEPDTELGAARFHAGFVAALADWLGRHAEMTGISRIVLSGGCFANRLLVQRLPELLHRSGMQVQLPKRISAGDAGIALGQAWVAAHRLLRRKL